MTDHRLSVSRAVVRHGATVLADVTGLTLEPGRPLTIVGESGSGKSVLVHALMGTLPSELAAEGSLRVGETAFDLADRAGRRGLWGRRLALLPQEPALALDPTMRVRGQVAEGAPAWRPRAVEPLRLADDRLARLGLPGVGRAFPHTLSGGMAQRVAYAAATIGGARVLFVDEPSKGLDRQALDTLGDLLLEHVAEGGLLLTITHDLRLARRLGGETWVMRRAEVVEAGPTERVLDTPAHPYTRRLVAAEPARWTYPWTARRDGSVPAGGAEPLVAARGIAKSFGATQLWRDVDLEIGAGDRWALTGPSGVGKTTLGNALLRLTAVDRGRVEHAPRARGRLQKLYQDPALSFPRRVSLEEGLRDVARRHGVAESRPAELVEELGLPASLLARRPDQVSGGELQRVAVVRAMLPRPVLVLADEATSRLDLASQAVTMDTLMRQVVEQGTALLVVTHDLELADAVTEWRLELGAPEAAAARVPRGRPA